MHHRFYSEFLRYARRATKRADEAEDLLQTVLLAAVETGRTDLTCVNNRRWVIGALRKRSLFDARSAIRRRKREQYVATTEITTTHPDPLPARFISSLPPALRTTALLALTGHNKLEIAWLLRLSDCALRQRIVSLKRRWGKLGGNSIAEIPGLSGSLEFGRIRKALLKPTKHTTAILASHDPDGNLFTISSQNYAPRQQDTKPATKKE